MLRQTVISVVSHLILVSVVFLLLRPSGSPFTFVELSFLVGLLNFFVVSSVSDLLTLLPEVLLFVRVGMPVEHMPETLVLGLFFSLLNLFLFMIIGGDGL